MKKLLLFLFIPFLGLAQMSGPTSTDVANGEGAAGLVWLGSPSNANLAINDVGRLFFSFQSKFTLKQSPTCPEPTGTKSKVIKFASRELNKLAMNFLEN